jgi:hypothetical protein
MTEVMITAPAKRVLKAHCVNLQVFEKKLKELMKASDAPVGSVTCKVSHIHNQPAEVLGLHIFIDFDRTKPKEEKVDCSKQKREIAY